MTPSTTSRQFAIFAITGGVGFLVDVGVLYLLIRLGASFLLARAASFLCAVATTWLVNRRTTFAIASRPSLREFFGYLAAMSIGGSINYASSYLIVQMMPQQSLISVAAVAIGSLLGLSVNFAVSKFWVFRYRR